MVSRGIDLVGSTARRYGDFAPYNIRLDSGRRGWIIDQPMLALEAVHRDVAWFLFNLERRLGWTPPLTRVARSRNRDLGWPNHSTAIAGPGWSHSTHPPIQFCSLVSVPSKSVDGARQLSPR